MKVETPQILWNSDGDKGINSGLLSVSMIPCGRSTATTIRSGGLGGGPPVTHSTTTTTTHVLATAGTCHVINLWKITFGAEPSNSASSPALSASNPSGIKTAVSYQERSNSSKSHHPLLNTTTQAHRTMTLATAASAAVGGATQLEFLCSLTRHQRAVNAVAFSPNGWHLATAGDGGVLVWSVPVAHRHRGDFWATTLHREQDLTVRYVYGLASEGLCDLSWSADAQRFMVGTIDHGVYVLEDKNFVAVTAEPEWVVVHRNTMDHTGYVQGVAYDPRGVYLASMSSDRTVRIHPRKVPTKFKKKVLRPANKKTDGPLPPAAHEALVSAILSGESSKLELGKTKLIKYRRTVMDAETGEQAKHHWYADESTLGSFFRRLAWTRDGAFLLTPAALWHENPASASSTEPSSSSSSSSCKENNNSTSTSSSPTLCTLLFARHQFDQPYLILPGLEKPSVAICPNPVLFTLPCADAEDIKENKSPSGRKQQHGLPYRSIFAVLTWDTVLVYDTHHPRPLAVVKGLHYSNLNDAEWSADGHHLVVCSTDGYISILSFAPGELGQVYTPPPSAPTELPEEAAATTPLADGASPVAPPAAPRAVPTPLPRATGNPLPLCEPGQTATLEEPPAKRSKTRITPILVSAPLAPPETQKPLNTHNTKRPSPADPDDQVHEAVHKLSLVESSTSSTPLATCENPPKKKPKKRAQLTTLVGLS